MTSIKIEPAIQANLFSGEQEVVFAAIKTIKEKGNKLYIPLLFDLLVSEPGEKIMDEISGVLSTVKDKEAGSSFVKAIAEERYRPIKKLILAACWQNGLDYSSHLPVFIDVVINDNWENAFEAFTVIDNLEHLPEQKTVEQAKAKIKNAMPGANEQKSYFLDEILTKIS